MLPYEHEHSRRFFITFISFLFKATNLNRYETSRHFDPKKIKKLSKVYMFLTFFNSFKNDCETTSLLINPSMKFIQQSSMLQEMEGYDERAIREYFIGKHF
jgi:hypothetical protein